MGKKRKETEEGDLMLPFVYDLSTKYVIVKGDEGLTDLERVLESATIVGIDTERKPDFFGYGRGVGGKKGEDHPTLLIQMAIRCDASVTRAATDTDDVNANTKSSGASTATATATHGSITEHCFIADLQLMNKKALRAFGKLMGALLMDSRVVKIGQGIEHDLWELCVSYPTIPAFHSGVSLLDTNAMVRVLKPETVQPVSLKNLVKWYLHCNLVKTQQLSNWSRRPLTPAQLHYAACDAVVLLRLYDAMECYAKSQAVSAVAVAVAAAAAVSSGRSSPCGSASSSSSGASDDDATTQEETSSYDASEAASEVASEAAYSFDYENCTAASRRSNSFDIMINGTADADADADTGADVPENLQRGSGETSTANNNISNGNSMDTRKAAIAAATAVAGAAPALDDDCNSRTGTVSGGGIGVFQRCLMSVDLRERVLQHLAKKQRNGTTLSASQALAVNNALRGSGSRGPGRLSNTIQHSLAAAAAAAAAMTVNSKAPGCVKTAAEQSQHIRFREQCSSTGQSWPQTDCSNCNATATAAATAATTTVSQLEQGQRKRMRLTGSNEQKPSEEDEMGTGDVDGDITTGGDNAAAIDADADADAEAKQGSSDSHSGGPTAATVVIDSASAAPAILTARQLWKREKRRRLKREKAIKKRATAGDRGRGGITVAVGAHGSSRSVVSAVGQQAQ